MDTLLYETLLNAKATGAISLRVKIDKKHLFAISPSAAPRLIAVVDFPTPPFWLMMAMIFSVRQHDAPAPCLYSSSKVLEESQELCNPQPP